MSGPSLRDIAARAGVSAASVSRVINDRPGVSDDTRLKVAEAMRELGWRPDQGYDPHQGALIGIVVPELDNPVFPLLASAIEVQLAKHGLTAVVGTSTRQGTAELGYIDVLLRKGVSGLVLVSGRHANPHADHGFYRLLHERGIPMVLVSGRVEGLAVPTVATDEALGARIAVAHLRELGHRRIGLAGGQGYLRPSINRLDGYRRAMRELLGEEAPADWYTESSYSIAGGAAAARQLFDAGVTAIVAGSDLMALGVTQAAREAGRSVPGDLSVVGYDDCYLAAHSNPPLTTVRQPIQEMGAAVAEALWRQLEGHGGQVRDYLFTPELVARESTGRLRHG
ncbi:LacI family DNA-binding transcriptional regulator [Kitasatospora sp. NPDC057542]|uniref:LacI family DNA-binding transcriptional regulator n=1 Tax=Kitasatospora sp. NPDC057542 TaxID=3346162 RepID=UPI00368452B1